MRAVRRKVVAAGLLASAMAWAGGPDAAPRKAAPQEPLGFITGGIIGAFAAGPFGAVIGAGIGTWLGNRVHRAAEAAAAEARLVALAADQAELQSEKDALQGETSVWRSTQAASFEPAADASSSMLDGLQGEVLFRTGSAEIAADSARGLEVLADVLAKSPLLKVRIDAYTDARGSAAANLKLSEDRAAAVRDLLVAGGVDADALRIHSYGKSHSVATDADGYALERRVRLTLQSDPVPAVARLPAHPCFHAPPCLR